MFSLRYILFACLPLIFTEASNAYKFEPCSIKDNDCVLDLFQKIFHDLGENGLEEKNIPKIDPMKINELPIKFLDDILIILKDAVIKGFKNCKVNRFNIDLDKQFANLEVECEVLTIKGHFVIDGSNPLLEGVFGTSSIKGAGKTKIKLDKITIGLEIPVTVIKKDGLTYFKVLTNKPKYTYDIQKVTFNAENFVIGKNDLSQFMTTYVNDNWKTLLKTHGKQIMDKAMFIVFEFIHKFYDNIDANKLVTEDLTPYIQN